MKKFIALILSIISVFGITFIYGCNENEDNLSFYVPDGAPAISIAKFIYDKEKFGIDREIDYHVVSSLEITSAVTGKNADIVVLPINSATKLYNANKNDGYVMASVITHGNFYIVSAFPLNSVDDLRGKIIYTPMRGKVPDLTLQHILKTANIDYEEATNDIPGDQNVKMRYFNEGADVIKALSVNANVNIIGLLPEPAATQISKKKTAYSYRLDVQELYDSQAKSYPQAVLIVKKSVVNKYSNLINQMGVLFSENLEWVKNNTSIAIESIKQNFSSSTLDISTMNASSIEGCKIYWQISERAKQSVINYIENIRSIDASFANEINDEFFL